MSYSKQVITATAGQQAYSLTFPVIQTGHVKATVGGSAVTTFSVTGDYTGGSGTVTFSSPTFAGGETIVLYRETGTTRLVDYTAGSALTEADLDTDSKQSIYLVEEQAQTDADTYQPLSEKGQASGYAGLNSSALVPVTQLGSGSASTSTYLRGDGSWQPVSGSGGGGGDVYSPGAGTVTQDEVVAFGNTDGTTLEGTGLDFNDLLVTADLGDTIAELSSGLVPTAQLGTGTADNTKFLRGDGTWATPAGGGTGNLSSTGTIDVGDIPSFVDANTVQSTGLTTADLVLASEKGTASGVATLNSSTLVPVGQLGTGAGGATKFLREDSTWQTITAGTGDVSGPAVSVDNTIPRFDGTGGKTLQTTGVVVDDSNNITGVNLVDGRDVSTDGAKLDTITVANIPSSGEKSALSGTSGTPGAGNKYVTGADTRMSPFVGDVGTTPTQGIVPAPAALDWSASHKFLGADGSWERINGSWLTGTVGIAAGGTSASDYNTAFLNLAPQVPGSTYKGHLIVRNANAPLSGGSWWNYLAPGSDNQVLTADSTQTLGVKWSTPSGGGDVLGPGSSTSGNLASYSDGTGTQLADSGVEAAKVLTDDDVVSSGGTADGVLGTISGLPDPADLGSGTPASGKYLDGTGAWVTLPTAGTGDISGPGTGSASLGKLATWVSGSPPSEIAVGAYYESDLLNKTLDANVAGGYASLNSVTGMTATDNMRPREWDRTRYVTQAVPGTADFSQIGWQLAPTFAGFVSEVTDSKGTWRRFTTEGLTSNELAGLQTVHFAYVQPRWLPDLTVRLRTPSTLSGTRLWIGFASADIWNSSAPTGRPIAAFRYIYGTDTGWTTYTANTGGTQVDTTAFSGSMVNDAVYTLRLRCNASGAFTFWRDYEGNGFVEGATVHTSTTLPTDGWLGVFAVMTTSSAIVRHMDISRLVLEHI